jgi:hypothetical protein
MVKYKKNYPRKPPILRLPKMTNLDPNQILEIQLGIDKVARDCSEKKEVMIFEACHYITEKLISIN